MIINLYLLKLYNNRYHNDIMSELTFIVCKKIYGDGHFSQNILILNSSFISGMFYKSEDNFWL